MAGYISVKRENGEEIVNPAERNIILLRYAAFLQGDNDPSNGTINIQQIQTTTPIQIVEAPAPARKTTKANAQNAQAANVQQTTKLSG